MNPLVIGAGAVGSALVASLFAEVRGVHDWIVPGAMWRTRHRHVALTFDDGPDPAKTPRLLDALAEADVRAVFFVIGQRAVKYPDVLRRIHAAGHCVGNHSWSHRWMPGLSSARIADEIDRCQKAVADITGAMPKFARPPYGQRDFRYYRVLAERGITPVLWSRNLRDYHPIGSSPATLVRRLERARAGDIVLCHDGDPLAPHTVSAVETWLPTAPAIGLL